jgi:serine phosphatase RsbU (regulator of sigma subunit)
MVRYIPDRPYRYLGLHLLVMDQVFTGMAQSFFYRWNLLRNLSIEHANNTLAILIALSIYQMWGGSYPFPGLSTPDILHAVGAIIIHFIILSIFLSGYILYHIRIQYILTNSGDITQIYKFFLLSVGLPYLTFPFSILATGLYVQNGLFVYLFFFLGLLLVAILSRQLSWAVESSRQQSRQLDKLEQLGRAIINAEPDASSLPAILEEHVPNMFPSGHIEIWLSPDQLLLKNPVDWPSIATSFWHWLLEHPQLHAFLVGDRLPWAVDQITRYATVVAPIAAIDSHQSIGGIYIELRALAQDWNIRFLRNLFPAIQTLAAQIASALHQAENYQQQMDYQNITQELRLAGKIQASFLPNTFPSLEGWQLAVTLLPARETSGDFFDVIQLSDGRLGILIADVADKGVGPALYMALCRTLIRTYALEYDAEPEVVFYAANRRLLQDARANLFVTAFYAVLDPASGNLSYCNAGHNPPFLLSNQNTHKVQSLARTGIPIGIDENSTWKQHTLEIQPGDTLVLYTDGIPDAQNDKGDFFDEENFLEITQSCLGQPAHEIQTVVLEEVQKFVGSAPQADDITLMVIVRDG